MTPPTPVKNGPFGRPTAIFAQEVRLWTDPRRPTLLWTLDPQPPHCQAEGQAEDGVRGGSDGDEMADHLNAEDLRIGGKEHA